METTSSHSLRDVLLTAVTPIAWGTTYVITKEWLPPHRPLFSAAIRALPIGLVLLAWRRKLPKGDWWWKAAVLGMLTIGAFYALLFVGAYLLPGGLASTLQATGPLAMIGLAFLLVGEPIRREAVVGSLLGLVGVAMLVLRSSVQVNLVGVGAALASVALSSLGFVLVKRWKSPVDPLTLTAWQLVFGGLFLLPLSLAVEGRPPHLDGPAIGGYLWLAIVATGLANLLWLRGLQRMEAATVSLIGLVNPVVATVLGVVISHEHFGPVQLVGMLLVFVGVLLGQPAVVRKVLGRRGTTA